MTFLPKSYKAVPKSGGHYMKLEEGDNKLRILSDAILGYLYWTNENKAVHLKDKPDEVPTDLRPSKWGQDIKHFWAFVVWNYKTKQIQILEITQVTIQDKIFDLHNSEDWGDPKTYNINILKSGEGTDTSYNVIPSPPSELSLEIANAYTEADVKLAALYSGADPFEK